MVVNVIAIVERICIGCTHLRPIIHQERCSIRIPPPIHSLCVDSRKKLREESVARRLHAYLVSRKLVWLPFFAAKKVFRGFFNRSACQRSLARVSQRLRHARWEQELWNLRDERLLGTLKIHQTWIDVFISSCGNINIRRWRIFYGHFLAIPASEVLNLVWYQFSRSNIYHFAMYDRGTSRFAYFLNFISFASTRVLLENVYNRWYHRLRIVALI